MMNFVKKLIARDTSEAAASGGGMRQELQTREKRYAVTAPVRFRHVGHVGWRSGRTVNLSRSGVLFESEAALAAGTVVDLAISLPVRDAAEGKTMIATAIVVRQLEGAEAAGRLALAARIVNYSM